jgi:hypothetical protein
MLDGTQRHGCGRQKDNAADNGRRLVVFTGPIFGDTDPVYRGCRFR